ncbi:BTAD domain-containing putative transcriptional regulator [Microbispora rosea]|uniref:BTAD domain-containing putative transcriptional regulator n=1 Tax=Microbispora rosea TaxID=58117 RepID=UPI0036C415CB
MTRFRLLDGLRALLAATVLTALIAGVPLVLYALAGSPVPAHLPGLGEIGHALTHRDDGTLFLAVVKVVSWAAWAGFVASTLVELTFRIRGCATPHLPGLGAAQWLSAQLISSVALAAGSPAAFVMAAVPPAAVVAAAPAALADTTAAPDAGHDPPRFAGADESLASGQFTTTKAHGPSGQAHARVLRLTHAAYQVRRGDCLWTIAERHLGDGDRYTEIAALNTGRVMPDGARFTQPDVIRPGWVLRMPAAATDLDRPQPPVADRHPGHPSDTPEFSRPHDGAPSSPQPPASQEFPKVGEQPAAVGDAAPPTHTPQTREARISAPEPTAILLTDGGEAEDNGPSAPVAAFAGGVAVGSLLTLARLRHAQRQARRRGRRITLPTDPDTLATEQELHRLAAPDARERARQALATLDDAITAAGRELPHMLGARVCTDTVELLLAQPAGTPPAPFTQGRTKATWRLDLSNAHANSARDVLPALLTTGHLDDGHALLVNLERLQTATATGPDELVDRFLTTAATELITSDGPWFDVLAVGFPELQAAGTRIRPCTDLTEALGLLADRARDLRGGLATSDGPADVADRRLHDPDGDWTLTVLISRNTPSPDQLARLVDTVTALPGGLAALVPADAASAPARFVISQDDQGPLLNVTPPGLTVRPPLMPLKSYQRLGELFTAAADTTDVAVDDPPYDAYAGESLLPPASGANGAAISELADDQQEHVAFEVGEPAQSEAAEPESQRDEAMEVVQVSILGPLEITGTVADLQPKMAELVLALTLAGPSGLRNVQLAAMMGPDPDTPKPSDQLRQLITRTRGKLGKAPDSQARILCDSAYVYRTHAITLDWTRFQELADRGAKRNSTTNLWDALALVRGPVLDGCYHWWLETPVIENIRAEIVDAADLLAELELDAGRPDRSARAARQGLASDPYAEQLWRALMRAEYEAGNMSRVHEAWKACLKAVAEVSADGDPHPETAALYRRLAAARRSA